jgi:hypothetical protein
LCLNPRRVLSQEPDVGRKTNRHLYRDIFVPRAAQKFGLTAGCDSLRARPAICGASGVRASIPTPSTDGARGHVDPFRQEVLKRQEHCAEEDERQIEPGASAQACAYCGNLRNAVQALETSPEAAETSPSRVVCSHC